MLAGAMENSPQMPPQLSPEPPPPCHKAGSPCHPKPMRCPKSRRCRWQGFTHTSKKEGELSFPFPFLFTSDRSKCDKSTAGEQRDSNHIPLLPARAKTAQPKHRGQCEINSCHRVQGKFEIQIGMFSSYYKHGISFFFVQAALAYLYYYHRAFWSYVCNSSHNNLFLKKKKKQKNSDAALLEQLKQQNYK